MNPVSAPDELERRLSALPTSLRVSAGDARAIASLQALRVTAIRPRAHPPQRLAAGLAIAAIAIVAANFAVAYYAPTYGQALAAAPILGGIAQPLLQVTGITQANAVALNGSATSNGHTVQLVAGYADGLRTVILLEIDGRGLTGKPKLFGSHPGDFSIAAGDATLADQFGHVYSQRGGPGPTVLEFEPLVWPASKVGARLTLHITGLQKYWLLGPPPPTTDTALSGDWTLHATMIAAAMHDLALPAPVRTSDGVFSVTLLRFTGSELVIHWPVTGPINDQMDRAQYGSGAPGWTPSLEQLSRRFFGLALFDSSGTPAATTTGSGGEWNPGIFRGETTVMITHPGRYRMQLAEGLAAPADQRSITVP
jgi:hypothetical protein